jgi:hypothetical protein
MASCLLYNTLTASMRTMKKTRTADRPRDADEEMQPEYRFDYRKARPNRFVARLKAGSRAVVLDPDVAAVFATPESVNAVLRALIETMPRKTLRSAGRRRATETGEG